MARRFLALAAGLLIGRAAVPDDLPPGVLLLSHVRQHAKEELARLPNVTCLETVQRSIKPPSEKVRHVDTVRLEVLTNGDRELYASPGDRRFSEEHPIKYVGSGTIGDGYFGSYLRTVLFNAAAYKYVGEEEVAGRRLARWEFRVPSMFSKQTIDMQEGKGSVGLQGWFWADPKIEDVVRLEIHAEDIPPQLPITEAVWTIDYGHTQLSGDLDVLLPQTAEFRMVHFNGEVRQNQMDFTHCRVFGAKTSLSFDTPDSPPQTPAFSLASVDDTMRPLPPGLTIPVTLQSPITADLAVGALIAGTVTKNVLNKGATYIAAGSQVRGRIRRMERYDSPVAHYVVALEFTDVEVEGIRRRLDADLVDIDTVGGIERFLTTSRVNGRESRVEELSVTQLPGVATFFVRGNSLHLGPGLRTVWKTRQAPRD